MLPLVKVNLPPKEILMPELEEVLYGGVIAEGEEVYKFEAEFVSKFGVPSAVAMSSGTAALHCALMLAGVGDGDLVISTAMTAEPTNLSILHAGARVVWADVDPATGQIDPCSIEKLINCQVKAIIVVHYAGYLVDLDSICAIASRAGIPVIEDCAHALGAKYKGRHVGSHGDFSIFSFQAIKHITTVDGGVLCIRDESLLEKARRIRWFGLKKGEKRESSDIKELGYKYNMNNVAAAIGRLQLKSFDALLRITVQNAEFFNKQIESLPGFWTVPYDERNEPSYWLYTLFCENPTRAEALLSKEGVQASRLHKCNHLHAIFKDSYRSLPNLEKYYNSMLHIPVGWWVEKEDRELIISVLREC